MCVLDRMVSDIQAIGARQLEKSEKHVETPDKTFNNTVNGKYSPYGITGYIVDECSIVCSDCVKTSERDPKNAIHTDSESDYPGFICEDCNNTLDTYLLVYPNQDPEIWYKAVMAEDMGMYDKLPTYPEIGDYVSNEAYSIGYSNGPSDLPEKATLEDIDISMFTESANYINSIAPELRALCGYQDSGKGTHIKVPNDTAYHIFHEDCFPSFHEGYLDKAKETLEDN